MSVSSTPSLRASALLADKYCGPETRLIYYMKAGSILSRTFTSKDTHSARGDLLVVYSDARSSMRDSQAATDTTGILGFSPPSFTSGSDLILPVSANSELRQLLVPEGGSVGAVDEDAAALAAIMRHGRVHVPQVRPCSSTVERITS